MKTRKRRAASQPAETVGDRIRERRQAKGLTQADLAEQIGISRRALIYYEAEGGSLSPELLVQFSEALGVSTDVLAGRENGPRRQAAPQQPENLRLWRRLKRIEELPVHDRKTILKMIDAMANQVASRKAS